MINVKNWIDKFVSQLDVYIDRERGNEERRGFQNYFNVIFLFSPIRKSSFIHQKVLALTNYIPYIYTKLVL